MKENLALSDDILMKIEKPERYIGHEVNSVIKDKEKIKVRFAMCFPDVYEIGMSHLGMQILHAKFNSREDVYCERVFSPWMDLDPILRERKIRSSVDFKLHGLPHPPRSAGDPDNLPRSHMHSCSHRRTLPKTQHKRTDRPCRAARPSVSGRLSRRL